MRKHPPQKRTLNSFLSTLIKTYQAICFDMNANATTNMDRAAVDVDESSKSAMTIMTLPLELRDFIYEGVVGTKYRFDAYQIFNGVPLFSEPPTLSEPRNDLCAKLCYDPAIRDLRQVPYGECRQKSGEVLYRYPFPPLPSLSILRTSARVRKEALHVLYQKGTLLFVLNHPSHSVMFSLRSQGLIEHFNNVDIFLDLVSIYNHSLEPQHEMRAIGVAMRLIERSANSVGEARTCTLSTYHRYDRDVFETTFFEHVLDVAGKLCVFKKVVLRFGNRFTTAEKGYAGSSTELAARRSSTDKWAVSIYNRISRTKEFCCLGPCEQSYDSEGFYCMVFHPKDQPGRGGSSKSGSD